MSDSTVSMTTRALLKGESGVPLESGCFDIVVFLLTGRPALK